MQKLEGVHFYININDFNNAVIDEESDSSNVTHAIHALDTYFSSIERYAKKHFPQTLVVEKITGARLHMYIVDAVESAYAAVKTVTVFAYRLVSFINKDISKYKTLRDFEIQIGAAYGKFYDFEFTTNEGFSELTTIGHAANYAAKLQALSGISKVSISSNIYDALSDDEQLVYTQVCAESIKKYGQDCYYTTQMGKLKTEITITEDDLNAVREYANNVNLSDIEFADARKLLDFANLSKTQCKKIAGIPVFADVRGFTSQFKEDDSNLEEMTITTQNVLNAMYNTTVKHNGVHVQFQGDRELSLYHDMPEMLVEGHVCPETKSFKTAVLAAMRMIDAVKPLSVHIGVGADFGRLFATKIGARGEKDNILLGMTVINADEMEDKNAGEDQLAITKTIYDGLEAEDTTLAHEFKTTAAGFYVTTIGFTQYMRNLSYSKQQSNTSKSNYNGAWGDLL